MSDSFVSIAFVVAAYNVSPYLPECLAAIELVVRAGDEVIIINDGSTDDTGAIAHQWCKKHQLLGTWRVIDQANRGLSGVRRVGMHAASTDYILFADGDDQIMGDAFAQARWALQQSRPDILVADYWEWAPQVSDALHRSKHRTHAKRQLLTDQQRNLQLTYEDAVPCVWGRIFSRDLLLAQDPHIFPEWSMFDDLPSTPFLTAAAKSLWYEPVALVKYRSNPGGLTKVYSLRSCLNLAQASIHAAHAVGTVLYSRALQTAATRMLLRKLRDNMKMVKRVRPHVPGLRGRIALIYAQHFLHAGGLVNGLALLQTGRFGDVKAFFTALIHLGMVAPWAYFFGPKVQDTAKVVK